MSAAASPIKSLAQHRMLTRALCNALRERAKKCDKAAKLCAATPDYAECERKIAAALRKAASREEHRLLGMTAG